MLRFDSKEEALSTVYGYSAFRGVQAQAIDAACTGSDVLVVMATGGGKSLCYQIPPLVLGRAAVVVSPLVSLMQDQVMALEARGLAACYLGSAQTDAGIWDRLGDFQYVYVTPETANTDRFHQALATDIRPCLLAIDEVHCVSEWGNDFRPEYRLLSTLRQQCFHFPIMAVTATATERTRRDICDNLGLDPVVQLVTTVDRANLTYTMAPHKSWELLAAELRPGSIVYVPTTREADAMADRISTLLPARAYHGKMSVEERKTVHHLFLRDEVAVVVATLAFGMGIDKPDIRLVAHWGPPKTIEAYYQQAGRAGRDGDPARCILLVDPSDWVKVERILTMDEAAAPRAIAGLDAMKAFCRTPVCRRVALVAHFGGDGEAAITSACGVCDVCTRPACPTEDATANARALLECARALRGRFGTSTVLAAARGSPPDKYPWMRELAGAARGVSLETLRRVCDASRDKGLVADVPRESSSGHAYAALEVTEAGLAWLADDTSMLRVPMKTDAPKRARSTDGDDALMQKLKTVRRNAANGLPPYMVCSDATLRDMARRAPTTREALLAVSGIGPQKADKYGDVFLAIFRTA